MGSRFHRECAVGIGRLNLESCRLYSCTFRIGCVEDASLVALAFSPPQVHTHEHLSEVCSVNPARTGPNSHDSVPFVVLTVQQGSDLQLSYIGLKGTQISLRLCKEFAFFVLVGRLFSHFNKNFKVIDACDCPIKTFKVGLHVTELRGHLLSLISIIPKVGGSCGLRQPRNLRLQEVRIGDSHDVTHGGSQCGDGGRKVSTHT